MMRHVFLESSSRLGRRFRPTAREEKERRKNGRGGEGSPGSAVANGTEGKARAERISRSPLANRGPNLSSR